MPELPARVVARPIVEPAEEVARGCPCARFQLIPAPAKTPFVPCHVNPNDALSGDRMLLVAGRRRLPSSAMIGVVTHDRVVRYRFAVQFRGEAAGSCATASRRRCPSGSRCSDPTPSGIAADDEPGEAGELDALVHFLAHDRVER